MDRCFLLLVMLLAAADVSAAKLNKCVDESGHVTFTQSSCPVGQHGARPVLRDQRAHARLQVGRVTGEVLQRIHRGRGGR